MTRHGHETGAAPRSRGSGGPVTTGWTLSSSPHSLRPTPPRKPMSRSRWRASSVGLWMAALLGYVGADLATTAWGLQSGAVEANPIAAAVTGHGLVALAAMKMAVVGVALVAAWYVDEPAPEYPAALALVGVAAAAWNLGVILG